jgi:hypothetical protein
MLVLLNKELQNVPILEVDVVLSFVRITRQRDMHQHLNFRGSRFGSQPGQIIRRVFVVLLLLREYTLK